MVSNDTEHLSGSEVERALEATILSLIFVVALTGNLTLWMVVWRTRELRKEANLLLLCLSGADLLVSVVSMPVTIATILLEGWTFPQELCTAMGFINMIVFIASVMSLGAISINRYVRVCRPQIYRSVYTSRNIILNVLGVWLLSALLATPPLLGWGTYAFLPTQSLCFCDWRTSLSYTFFMVGTCFGGPCSIMTGCYVMILRSFRQSRRRVANHVPAASSTLGPATVHVMPQEQDDANEMEGKDKGKVARVDNTSACVRSKSSLKVSGLTGDHLNATGTSCGEIKGVLNKREERKEKRRQEEIRLSLSFLVIIGIFVLSWLPFCVTMFIAVFNGRVPRPADMTTLLLGYANSSYNPILYGFLNTSFKQAYFQLFEDLCCTFRKKFGGNSITAHVPSTKSRSKKITSPHHSMAPTSTF